MNNDGLMKIAYTLLIIGILIIFAIAVPYSIITKNSNKELSYKNKINNIETAAKKYGNDNKSLIIKGLTTLNDSPSTIIINSTKTNGAIDTFIFNINKKYKADEKLNNNEYRANRITLKELAELGYLEYDKTNNCSNCTEENKLYFNNIIINPKDNNVMNSCYVYIYYKDSNVFAHFDDITCNKVTEKPNLDGQEYKLP